MAELNCPCSICGLPTFPHQLRYAFQTSTRGVPRPVVVAQASEMNSVIGALFAVQVLKAMLQHPRGLVVQPAQQRGLPVVPHPRPDAADVAYGEHGQQLEPALRLHHLGEVADRARVRQVALLGVNCITERIRTVDGQITAYPAMGLSLTYDHRAVDGAPASRFLKDLVTALEHFDLLLIG